MKRRIGITQRVEDVPDRDERRDALDQAWTPWLAAADAYPVLIPNRLDDPAGFVREFALDGLVLTGGNDLAHLPGARNTAPERDATERSLLALAVTDRLPVVGVCRGMQLLVEFWGGALTRVEGHVARPHEIVAVHDARWPLRPGPVNSFHDWGIVRAGLPDALAILAVAPDDTVEAVMHVELPQVGVMWHPERAPAHADDRTLFHAFMGGGA